MLKKISIALTLIAGTLATPFMSLAQSATLSCQQGTLCYIISLLTQYLSKILFLMMALAVVMFVWYIIKYFIKADADRKAAGQYVLYSLIGFFVILSLWGIIAILGNTFGLGNSSNRPASWSSFSSLFPSN